MTQIRSRKPIIGDFGDDGENLWFPPHSASPPSSLSVNNSFTHQPTSGSWGFDVNRSTNGQTPSYNNKNNDQQTKDYSEQFVDRSSSTENFRLRTPTLTRQKNGNEFSAVDRLVRGSNRELNRPNETFQTQMNSSNQHKTQAENELLAWQNRMLEREQRFESQPPKLTYQRTENNSSRSSIRQIPTSMRPISTISDDQPDHNESTIRTARVIKRYIELLYHLQSFYERMTEQLCNGNHFLKNDQTIFANHCRKITGQLQHCKPIWEEKLGELQNLLKDVASSQSIRIETETTFLHRRSTLNNLLQTLSIEKDLDNTSLSIRTDIDRVLYDDKLAVQLQDELSTLLHHQSLLNDFTSLLQCYRSIYSLNEQTRVDNVLPSLREQITTTDNYVSHVSQQLTDLVLKLRSSEKYILSYTNTVPSIDDALVPSQNSRNRSRPYDETDVDSMRVREFRHSSDNLSKIRSISMPRIDDTDYNFDRDFKRNNHHLNNNNNNNNQSSTRLATIKPAKRDLKPPLSSILKPPSNRRREDYDIDTEIFKPTKVDIPDRLVDFDDDDNQILTVDERLNRMKKRDDVRKMVSKQNNDPDFSDGDYAKPIHLQSILAEEAKERSRQVAVKHYLNKSQQQRSIYPNA